jgi:hypothetical protein
MTARLGQSPGTHTRRIDSPRSVPSAWLVVYIISDAICTDIIEMLTSTDISISARENDPCLSEPSVGSSH